MPSRRRREVMGWLVAVGCLGLSPVSDASAPAWRIGRVAIAPARPVPVLRLSLRNRGRAAAATIEVHARWVRDLHGDLYGYRYAYHRLTSVPVSADQAALQLKLSLRGLLPIRGEGVSVMVVTDGRVTDRRFVYLH